MANQRRIPAAFYRGGTSKAVIFKSTDLPRDPDTWPEIFSSVMGSPDPNGRQLDGMGGGLSSLSKICVVGPPTRPDADVDYTFAQVGIVDDGVDFGGNCGNMSSAIGPFAVDEGLVPVGDAETSTTVRIHNTNTGQIIEACFAVQDGWAGVDGDHALPGVSGTGSPIELRFLNPVGAGTGTLFPTGHRCQHLELASGKRLRATLIDGANPLAIVPAVEIGLDATETPDAIAQRIEIMTLITELRVQAAITMGLAEDVRAAENLVFPQIAFVAPMQAFQARDGSQFKEDDADVLVRAISAGQPHRAVPLTCAMTLAIATRITGTIAFEFTRKSVKPERVRIAHPSGVANVGVDIDTHSSAEANGVTVRYAAVTRTARRLFDGFVYLRD